MTDLPWGWLLALAVLGFWTLGAYNRVVALRGAVTAAWQQLDAVIQSRQQAIGSMVDAAEPVLAAERPTLEAMVAAQVQVATAAEVVRRQPTSEEPLAVLAKSEIALSSALARLVALVENDAALAQSGSMTAVLADLNALAPRERFARKTFNEAATAYNAAIVQFPTRVLARIFGFGPAGTL